MCGGEVNPKNPLFGGIPKKSPPGRGVEEPTPGPSREGS